MDFLKLLGLADQAFAAVRGLTAAVIELSKALERNTAALDRRAGGEGPRT